MTNYITKTIKNGVEANIPVTSVNGQYGDVVVAGNEYHAGEGIEIGDDYSAMQGPCPEGFHVPLSSEWQAIYDILITTFGLAQNDTTMGAYLKMPMAGYRNYSNSSINSGNGRYWSSSKDGTGKSSYLRFYSTALFQESGIRSQGLSIRAFKNTSIVPNNSWTTLYDGSSTASGAGIFRSSSLGLISISGDGTTWITIADKNLGATETYSNGDTLVARNCGYYYQRGNNYGFPRTGTVTTSSTQVNASNYGPGNYYNSSTFITRSPQYSSSPYNWDSSNNDNLWGATTGVITNTITNTGVLSVNGQTGDVVVAGAEYSTGEGIAIGTAHSDMQGPAPDGFHVPLGTEWQAIYDILITTFGLASNATTMGTYLKMPMAGFRGRNNADVYEMGNDGGYWSSNPYGATNAYYLRFTSSYLNPQSGIIRTEGHSVRCFKDTPTVPTSSWTTLYQGILADSGVFWNSTDGLISISGDGFTWITIQDKNLGATTVYNYGDTLTDANCGNFYQWGNNYGFAHSGSLTTSSTRVDTTNYGPGNYYSSSTFITSTQNRSSVQNDNLWGGVSQGTWIGGDGNTIANTGVLSVNGQTGDVSNVVTGDGQYVINVSTTAPASGTASNIITIVTD